MDQTYYVENTLFQRKPDYLLKVRGMSMRDAGIMDGDLLLKCRPQRARNGQIIVARLGEEVTIRRPRHRQGRGRTPRREPRLPHHRRRARRTLRDRRLAVRLIRNTMLM